MTPSDSQQNQLTPFMAIAADLQGDKTGDKRDALLNEINKAERLAKTALRGGLDPNASEATKQRLAALAAAQKIITLVWHVNHAEAVTR